MTRANDIASFGDEIENNEVALSTTIPTDVSDLTDSTSLLSSGSGVTAYANVDVLPLSGEANGALGYVESTNRLYMFNGTGWYSIALINQSPTIDANTYQATYTLDTAGANTVVELVATDPEGIPITWSYTANNLGNTATISQSSNVFTITPSTVSSNAGTFSVTFKASDGVNIGTASSEFTLTFLSSYWKDVALLTGTNDTNGLQNDSFVDRSTNGYTITTAGTPSQTPFHPYLDNYSVEFDGSDYVKIDHDVALATDDFTIEMWVEITSSSDSYGRIIESGAYNTNDTWRITYNNTSPSLMFQIGNTSTRPEITTSTSLTSGSWYHIAVCREGNTIRMFVNGTQEGGDLSYSGSLVAPTQTGEIWLGTGLPNSSSSSPANYHNGSISNLRIVKGTALYTSNFTPPTEKLTAITNTVLLTCQSNRFIDNSSSAHTVTPVGDAAIKSFNPFGQDSVYAPGENKGSVYFDGNGDYLSFSNIDISTSQSFCAEAWVYLSAYDNEYSMIFGGPSINASDQNNTQLRISAQGDLLFAIGGAAVVSVSGGWPGLNQWVHFAAVRNTDSCAIYINGVSIGSGTSSNAGRFSLISETFNGATQTFYNINGYVSDARITIGNPVYTSAFTPPTSPVGNTNATLYLPMDNAGIFDQSGNHTLTLVGDAQTSTTQTKYATTSMYFDGTGDYVTISDLGLSGDITLEGWFYQSVAQSATYRCIIGASTYGSSLPLRIYTYNSNFEVWLTGAGGPHISGSFTANTWHHVALVRSSGTWTLYIDGTSAGTSTTSGTYDFASTVDWTIGADAATTYPFTGYIEDFQIINGQAKYTSSFTPPTSSLSRANQ